MTIIQEDILNILGGHYKRKSQMQVENDLGKRRVK